MSVQQREKNELELMGERLLIVCKDHHADTEPTIELIADALWALGARLKAVVVAVDDPPAPTP